MTITLSILTLIILILTCLPFVKSDFWVFRITEYLRLQKLIVAVIVAATIVLFKNEVGFGWLLLFVPLCFCVVYLIKEVIPYSVFGFKEVIDSTVKIPEASFKIFSANVLMSNEDYGRMLDQINGEDPDIIFLLEAGSDWDAGTAILKDKYPYALKEPIDNTYGLLFYSK